MRDTDPTRPEHTVDTEACSRNTLQNFPTFYVSQPLGYGVENRYTPEDQTSSMYARYPNAPGSIAGLAAANQLKQRILSGEVALSDELRDAVRQGHKQAREQFGRNVQRLAPELFTEISIEQFPLSVISNLDDEPWTIGLAEDETPLLILPTGETKTHALAARLDDIHMQRPEELKAIILDFHEASARHHFTNSELSAIINNNHELHDIDKSQLLPDFLRKIEALDDFEEGLREMQAICTHLTWMRAMGLRENWIHNFEQALRTRRVPRTDAKIGPSMDKYFSHVAECPGESEEAQMTAASMLDFYQRVGAIRFSNVTDVDYKDWPMELFRSPATFFRKAEHDQNAAATLASFLQAARIRDYPLTTCNPCHTIEV